MNYYSAYGMTVGSELPIPEFPAADRSVGEPDVVVRQSDLEPVLPEGDDSDAERHVEVRPGCCQITYDGVGTVQIEEGESVLVDFDTSSDTSRHTFRRVVARQAFAVALHQRGMLVLHASAVAIDDDAVVFCGPRGVGKSTTAGAFYAAGNQLLCDDLVPIRFVEDTPHVIPGTHELRLTPDTAAVLGLDSSGNETGDNAQKRHFRADGARGDESYPLGRCYSIRPGTVLAIESVSLREQILTLVSNTYTVGLLDETNSTRNHFQQCSRLVESAPLHELRRPDSFTEGGLDAIVQEVTADLQSG